MEKVGRWAFILGMVIAVVAGLGFEPIWSAWVLAVLGLVVGFMNVTSAETQGFMLSAIGLMLSATAVQMLPFVGDVLTAIMVNLVVFIAPAVLVVALKTLFHTASKN